MGSRFRLFLVVNAALLLSTDLAAALLVSNLDEARATTVPIGGFGGGGINQRRGSSFTTGSNSGGYTLDKVTIAVGTQKLNNPTEFQVFIFDESLGLPNASLETLSGSADPTTGAENDYTSSNLSLSANTTYFVIASANDQGTEGRWQWDVTASDVQTSSDGWTISDDAYISTNLADFTATGTSSVQFSVTATAVPEPHEYAIVAGLGLIGFATFRGRRLKMLGASQIKCENPHWKLLDTSNSG